LPIASQFARIVAISREPLRKPSSSRVLAPNPCGAKPAHRHQEMRMVVPLIAVPVRGMDGKIDRHSVAFDERRGKLAHRFQPLPVIELVRQRQNDVASGCRAVPPSRLVLRALRRIP
jgi:hypothetical protein